MRLPGHAKGAAGLALETCDPPLSLSAAADRRTSRLSFGVRVIWTRAGVTGGVVLPIAPVPGQTEPSRHAY